MTSLFILESFYRNNDHFHAPLLPYPWVQPGGKMSAWQRGEKETSWQSTAYGDISTLIECTSENIFRYRGGQPPGQTSYEIWLILAELAKFLLRQEVECERDAVRERERERETVTLWLWLVPISGQQTGVIILLSLTSSTDMSARYPGRMRGNEPLIEYKHQSWIYSGWPEVSEAQIRNNNK